MMQQEKLLAIHRILCETHGAPFPYFSDKDPVSELVSALLSHCTKNATTAKAYQQLVLTFPNWAAVRDADPDAVEACIHSVTYAIQKTGYIQNALRRITDYNDGEIDLDFLKSMPPLAARTWLEKMPGVGAKTSAAVLNFSYLRIPALVVDTHHLRVAKRVNLIADNFSIAKASKQLFALLPPDWTAQEVYDHHEAFMYHGQRVCSSQKPNCAACTISYLCEYAKKKV